MKRIFLLPILTATISAAPVVMPAAAQTTVVSGASLRLKADAAPPSGASQLRYTVAATGASDASRFNHDFFLTNNGSILVTLTEVRPSCGCTTALLGQGQHTPLVLAPGQQVSVWVSLDSFHLTPGAIDKHVWFFVAGSDKPAATLDITGNILPVAVFTPAVLDFGNISTGQAPSLPLTVTVDPILVPAGDATRLVSSNPDVQVSPVASSDGPMPDKAQRYQVSLAPHARLGPISGQVALEFLTHDGSGSQTLPGGSVSLRGTVVGAVAASPSVIAFGMVAAGQTAIQQALLSGKDFSGVTVSTDSRFLTARLVPVAQDSARPFGGTLPVEATGDAALGNPSGSPNALATLEVSLSPQAPPGPLTSQVLVKTPGGQTLALPVFAYVTAKGTSSP